MRKRKNEDIKFPNPFLLSHAHDGAPDPTVQKEIYQRCFEGNVCLEILKALRFTPDRIDQFPVCEYKCLWLSDVNKELHYKVAVVDTEISLEDFHLNPNRICRLYFSVKEPIVIINDYNKSQYHGIALASFNIAAENVVGCVTIINISDKNEPLLVGKTANIFSTLLRAGHLHPWDGSDGNYDD